MGEGDAALPQGPALKARPEAQDGPFIWVQCGPAVVGPGLTERFLKKRTLESRLEGQITISQAEKHGAEGGKRRDSAHARGAAAAHLVSKAGVGAAGAGQPGPGPGVSALRYGV